MRGSVPGQRTGVDDTPDTGASIYLPTTGSSMLRLLMTACFRSRLQMHLPPYFPLNDEDAKDKQIFTRFSQLQALTIFSIF